MARVYSQSLGASQGFAAGDVHDFGPILIANTYVVRQLTAYCGDVIIESELDFSLWDFTLNASLGLFWRATSPILVGGSFYDQADLRVVLPIVENSGIRVESITGTWDWTMSGYILTP
jgi:hypothetical protein